MKKAILHEKELHPAALPQDYIKLIFQSVYGPGHLINDRSFSAQRLYAEWETVKHLPAEPPQDIGGGYVRLCLKGQDGESLDRINTAFVTSANMKTGSDTDFLAKLELMCTLAAEGRLSFSEKDARRRTEEYLSGGIRPTSHTREYHRHYTPAYRVVKADML